MGRMIICIGQSELKIDKYLAWYVRQDQFRYFLKLWRHAIINENPTMFKTMELIAEKWN